MAIISKQIEINICNSNKRIYLDKGYNIQSNGIYDINIEDVPDGCNKEVLVSCDYCGKEYYLKYHWIKNKNDICCLQCSPKKVKKTMIEKYGVTNACYLESAIEKQQNTNLERYGDSKIGKSKIIAEKRFKTNLEKYGNKYPIATETVKNKIKKQNIEKYGVEYPFQNKEYLAMLNRNKTNGNRSSKQQDRISDLTNGIKNYYLDGYYLDVFLKKDKICIEYDGGGHKLSVVLGRFSLEEFEERESKREAVILLNDIKIIRIINEFDIKFKDKDIMQIINNGIDILNKGYSIYKYNVKDKEVYYR